MNVVVYCGSNPGNNTNYAKAALELGAWIGDSGNTLVYGGSSVGLMGLISSMVAKCMALSRSSSSMRVLSSRI